MPLSAQRDVERKLEPWATSPVFQGTALVHLDFMLTGVVMALLGPMLPTLSARWSLNDTQAGYLFTAQFVASMAGMLLSSVLVRVQGYRWTLFEGSILMALGMATLAHSDWVLGFVSVCVLGAGFGVTVPAGNLLIAEGSHVNRAARLNLLNSSWGVGAVSCPLLVAVAAHTSHIHLFLFGTAATLATLALGLCLQSLMQDARQAGADEHAPAVSAANWWSVAGVAALFFVDVGIETCMGGWIALYARRLDSGFHAFWAITPSFFWGAMLLGRLLAPLALRRMRETRLATLGAAIAALAILVLLAAKTTALVAVAASLAGFGLASLYPINVSLFSHWLGDSASRVSGTVFAVGSLGGGILPWLVGVLSTRYESLRVGFIVPWLGALALVAFYLVNQRLSSSTLAHTS